MMKYWNSRRVRRVRERERRKRAEVAVETRMRARTYVSSTPQQNAERMLDALGLSLRRRMVERLRRGGAMSLSKLVEPFRITLPSAMAQLYILERAGIVATHKRGRVRICVYKPNSLSELAMHLAR